MSHVPFTNLLNKLIQQRRDPALIYEILIKQAINNEYLFYVNLRYKNTEKIRNLYQTLINESKKTNQNDQPNFISKNCKKLNEICTQNDSTQLRIQTSLEDSA